jgi:hypothetical protein
MGQLAVLEFAAGNRDEAAALYRQIVHIEDQTGQPILKTLNGYPEFVAMVEQVENRREPR